MQALDVTSFIHTLLFSVWAGTFKFLNHICPILPVSEHISHLDDISAAPTGLLAPVPVELHMRKSVG